MKGEKHHLDIFYQIIKNIKLLLKNTKIFLLVGLQIKA